MQEVLDASYSNCWNLVSRCTWCDQVKEYSWQDARDQGTWMQHGENPEHRRFFPDELRGMEYVQAVLDWGVELHPNNLGAQLAARAVLREVVDKT